MSTVIDFTPFFDAFVTLLVAVAAAATGVVARWLSQKTFAGKILSEETIRTRLNDVVQNGLAYAISKVNKPVTVDMKNDIVALAVRYVMDMAPETAAKLGLTPESAAARVEAELSKLFGLNKANGTPLGVPTAVGK